MYIWDYASFGNSQMFCKKVVFNVENRPLPPGVEVQPARIDSRIVNDVDCSHLTKPILK